MTKMLTFWMIASLSAWTDPAGWEQLSPGMTDRQVLVILGPAVHAESIGTRQVWYYQELPVRDAAGRLQNPPKNGYVVFSVKKEGRRESLTLVQIKQPDWGRIAIGVEKPAQNLHAIQQQPSLQPQVSQAIEPEPSIHLASIQRSPMQTQVSQATQEPKPGRDPVSVYFLSIGVLFIIMGIAFAIIRPFGWLK
ncbi:MAG TPA: hypothetical protein PLX18_11100 [Anaerohalosphaeraceae bacterium]|nr:hypothetical protein [Anaerohalosphaeraceae bacterium]HQI08387.1 hypothetical protein [Anaerohalosphaeraceae bacterium]